MTSLKRTWLEAGMDEDKWKTALDKNRDAQSGKINLTALENEMLDCMKQQCLDQGAPDSWFEDDGVVPLTRDYVRQLGGLSKLPLMPDELVLSYSTFGDTDDKGELIFLMMAMSNSVQMPRKSSSCSGKPKLEHAEALVLGAMLAPMAGPAYRPTEVLWAHRWGQEIFQELEPFLREHGVASRLETREEAEHSASCNDVDADGNNFHD